MRFVSIKGFARVCAAVLFCAAAAGPVAAQTLQLTDSSATVLRGGSYANSNFASDAMLATRASSDADYVRRILLKFDTHNEIAANSPVASATLTLTVAGGNAQNRTLAAYRVTSSYDETAATWNRRSSGTSWSQAGGDLAEQVGAATVTHTSGSRITYDVTAMVRAIVSGTYGSSRYARFIIADSGSSSRDSYKEFFSDEAADSSVRPTLTVTLGSSPAPPPPPPSSSGTVNLRVLMWNLHHGVGTDGRYDLDRIATWMASLNPDVITLNEVEKFTGWGNENQPARYEAMMEAKTGKQWYSVFAQEYGNWSSNGKGHQILSTYPIESVSMVEISYDRVVAMARIIVNGRTITVVTTHLDPESLTRRLTQATQAVTWATGFPENRILTGDMNAWPDQSSIAYYNRTYRDSWAVAAAAGTASSFSGNAPFGATKNGRIDYIFFSANAPHLRVVSSRVPDTRNSSGHMPSDHRPVLTVFEVR